MYSGPGLVHFQDWRPIRTPLDRSSDTPDRPGNRRDRVGAPEQIICKLPVVLVFLWFPLGTRHLPDTVANAVYLAKCIHWHFPFGAQLCSTSYLFDGLLAGQEPRNREDWGGRFIVLFVHSTASPLRPASSPPSL